MAIITMQDDDALRNKLWSRDIIFREQHALPQRFTDPAFRMQKQWPKSYARCVELLAEIEANATKH